MADETDADDNLVPSSEPEKGTVSEASLQDTGDELMIGIITRYSLDELNRVSLVTVTNGHDWCRADLNEDGHDYKFRSKTITDDSPVTAPMKMSLADCLLAANVILGLIPPHDFAPIECPIEH